MKDNKAKMKDFLQPLESIRRVEAPRFLFDTIQERIERKQVDRVPLFTTYAVAASFVILMSINAFVISRQLVGAKSKVNIAEAFQMNTDNNLYR